MTPLDSVLVANRGEIARRILRTARLMGLRGVAVHVDADAGAPFVADADEAVRLPDGGYLDPEAVVRAALDRGVHAVHPGYGFLSENADLARRVVDAGLVWVGPTPEVIESMGDKLAAKRLAVEAGVPTLPSAEDPAGADAVGYPLLVKAAAGGGGKGMRVVTSPRHLDEALASARREAGAGFDDDRVFLERYVAPARHIEVQIIGDEHGHLVHLGERECSIQRRHQKIVEEAPAPGVDGATRARIWASALTLGRALGYRSAGTVEFLYDERTGDHYFIEVNTRLQVEHPVTEEVTGIDLVREQLRVAAGEPLGFTQDDVSADGHAIEVRLYAEDPTADFLPATGTLTAYRAPPGPGVRWESGVEAGSVVGLDFDPLLAKVVAHAPTRPEAARRLARALEGLHLGGVATNRAFLAALLRDAAFLAGDTTTDYLDRVDLVAASAVPDDEVAYAAAALALWLQGRNRDGAVVLGGLPSGWRNARLPRQSVALRHGDATHVVEYAARRDGRFEVGERTATVHRWEPDLVDLEVDGVRRRCAVTVQGVHAWVQVPWGTVALEVVPRFPPPRPEEVGGGLAAPMPGAVVEVRVGVDDVVDPGDVLVVLEAMKIEHHVRAPVGGVVVDVRVGPGDQVANGEVLLVVDDGTGEGGG